MSLLLVDRFSLPAALDQLEKLENRIDTQFSRWNGHSGLEHIRYNVMLAVQEICVNIIHHAYGDQPGTIDVAVYSGKAPARVEVVLHDTGASFDPAAAPKPTLGEVQEGGLGLYLTYSLMDDVVYACGDAGNWWRLVKYLP